MVRLILTVIATVGLIYLATQTLSRWLDLRRGPVVKSYCKDCRTIRPFWIVLGTREAHCKKCGLFKATYEL